MRHSRSSASRITASMCPGPVSRRSILEAGSLGLGMLGLGDVLKLRAEQPAAGSGAGAGAGAYAGAAGAGGAMAIGGTMPA